MHVGWADYVLTEWSFNNDDCLGAAGEAYISGAVQNEDSCISSSPRMSGKYVCFNESAGEQRTYYSSNNCTGPYATFPVSSPVAPLGRCSLVTAFPVWIGFDDARAFTGALKVRCMRGMAPANVVIGDLSTNIVYHQVVTCADPTPVDDDRRRQSLWATQSDSCLQYNATHDFVSACNASAAGSNMTLYASASNASERCSWQMAAGATGRPPSDACWTPPIGFDSWRTSCVAAAAPLPSPGPANDARPTDITLPVAIGVPMGVVALGMVLLWVRHRRGGYSVWPWRSAAAAAPKVVTWGTFSSSQAGGSQRA